MPNAKLHFPKGADAACSIALPNSSKKHRFFVCVQIDSCSRKDFQIPPRALELLCSDCS